MPRVRLLELDDLERSLPIPDGGEIDATRAEWAIEMVSAAAVSITRQAWQIPEDVPIGCVPALAMAARRLYTNPDRFTREAEGDYSYGLDATVTKADIFTPSEKATLLEHAVSRRVTGLRTIGTYRGDISREGTVYVPDGSRYGFPWYSEEET